MKVILTQNMPKLGQVGDLCQVADGYGRNYLLPQGLAILASKGAQKQIDDLKRTEAKRQDRLRGEMSEVAKRIEALDIRFEARVGETGRLYGSITSSDIAGAIEEQMGMEIDRRKVVLDETLRTLGAHTVPVHLMPGVVANATVIVEADEENIVADAPSEVDLGLDDEDAGEAASVAVDHAESEA
jgi:large subunit ribosomal protein L9